MAPPNRAPIFTYVGDIQWIYSITAANTNADITSGTSYLLYTADATNGAYVAALRLKAQPGNSTVATVLRVWINNVSTTGTAANTTLYSELTIPATTTSNTAAQTDFQVPLNVVLPPGYKIYVTLGTAPGGSGKFMASAYGGKY